MSYKNRHFSGTRLGIQLKITEPFQIRYVIIIFTFFFQNTLKEGKLFRYFIYYSLNTRSFVLYCGVFYTKRACMIIFRTMYNSIQNVCVCV